MSDANLSDCFTLEDLLRVRDHLVERRVPTAHCPSCGAPMYVAAHSVGRTLIPTVPMGGVYDPLTCPYCGSLQPVAHDHE